MNIVSGCLFRDVTWNSYCSENGRRMSVSMTFVPGLEVGTDENGDMRARKIGGAQ